MRNAVAIRHVHFEDLGILEPVLVERGFRVNYYDVGVHPLWTLQEQQADLLIVLGGPIGVHEVDKYPFIEDELELLRTRLRADRPTLGICLGAQLIAAAAGARVYPSGIKEIGFSTLEISEPVRASPLRHLVGSQVLHWHGDTFDLPRNSRLLASTSMFTHQAFSIGKRVLGLQFHCEVDLSRGIEPWLIGHAAELTAAAVDPTMLRSRAEALRTISGAREMFCEWLDQADANEDRLTGALVASEEVK